MGHFLGRVSKNNQKKLNFFNFFLDKFSFAIIFIIDERKSRKLIKVLVFYPF
jgi:hypothetical protein